MSERRDSRFGRLEPIEHRVGDLHRRDRAVIEQTPQLAGRIQRYRHRVIVVEGMRQWSNGPFPNGGSTALAMPDRQDRAASSKLDVQQTRRPANSTSSKLSASPEIPSPYPSPPLRGARGNERSRCAASWLVSG